MRRGAALACALACVSCGSTDTAIVIKARFTPDPSLASIVVYLAHEPMTAADANAVSLQAEKDGSARPTQIYGRLDPEIDALDVAALSNDGEAVFEFEQGTTGEGRKIPLAIIVGLPKDSTTPLVVGTLEGLAMAPGKVVEYDVDLVPATLIAAPDATSNSRGVELWGKTDSITPATACIRVSPGSGDGSNFQAIVLDAANDPDCDGPHDCPGDADTFDGTAIGANNTCVGTLTVPDPAQQLIDACALGAPTCIDGTPGAKCGSNDASTTTDPTLCAYPSLCTICGTADSVVACVKAADPNTTSYLECTFSVGVDACDGETLPLPSDLSFSLQNAAVFGASPTNPPNSIALDGSGNAVIADGGVTLDSEDAVGSGVALLVSISQSGGPGSHGVVVPIQILALPSTAPDCTADLCQLVELGSDRNSEATFDTCAGLTGQ